MAQHRTGKLCSLSLLILTQAWLTCNGHLTMDQLIEAATETSKMTDMLQDSQNILVELDMMFKADDWMEISEMRVPFPDDDTDDDGDYEEARKRRRRRDILNAQEREKRNAIRQLSKRWSGKVMPYSIQPGTFDRSQMNQINAAIADYNRYTCLSLVRRSNQRNYVNLQNGGGCSSYVGMVGGRQPVSLAYGCRRKGIIVHELGHAAGFHHEQTRPDRDSHVRILRQNIPSSVLYNFQKYSTSLINTYNVPYDYTSVMHYGQYAFSTNGRPTIQTVDRSKQHLIGNRQGFSFADIKLLNIMYSCKPSRCSTKTCPSPGYVGKDCQCYCPGNPVKVCSGGGGTGGGGTGGGGTGGGGTGGGGTGGTCSDQNTNCAYWAANGECRNYVQFMGKNCRASCKLCGGTGGGGTGGGGTGGGGTGGGGTNCKDMNRYCRSWAGRGECNRNPRYMNVYCKKSCRKCGTSTNPAGSGRPDRTCQDKNRHCGYWANSGECQRNPAYMNTNCKRSCRRC